MATEPTGGDAASSGDSRTAIYFNKRAVARFDLPLAHTYVVHNDGWRIDFTEAGRLRLIMSEGHNDHLDVAAGDYLLAVGEDLYLSLQREPSASDRARAAKEERSRRKQEARESRPPKPAKPATPAKKARAAKAAR